MTASSEILFGSDSNVAPIGIIAMNSVTELGKKIDDYLVNWAGKGGIDVDTFLVESECPRFSSGDGKGLIKSTIRGKDLFIIVDVGNYSIKYDYFGMQNAMSPDDHFQDLKRVISAISGKAERISVVMPILYGGRQQYRPCSFCEEGRNAHRGSEQAFGNIENILLKQVIRAGMYGAIRQ